VVIALNTVYSSLSFVVLSHAPVFFPRCSKSSLKGHKSEPIEEAKQKYELPFNIKKASFVSKHYKEEKTGMAADKTLCHPATEPYSRVVSTFVSCSGGHRFISRPGDQLSWLRDFDVFLSPSRRMPEKHLKLGHDRFLSYPFEFIIR
jgi:hypothetical protein